VVPLGRLDGRPQPPFHSLIGAGLDARLFTDLSVLADGRLITPTEHFYVRTAPPATLPAATDWRIALGGPGATGRELKIDALLSATAAMGVHLMECSGNNDPANFGLLSAASWSGVPMSWVIDRLGAASGSQIRITGVDHEARTSSSLAGAEWVFPADVLAAQGAFLATHMNGQPLTAIHGAPVRLVVPNYYGCCAIKWVSQIDVVPDDEPVTVQMREFMQRTHQTGLPALAREYEPPAIDLTAAPIRVEQWRIDNGRDGDRLVYRVIGIRWGGTSPRAALTIRFGPREAFVPIEESPDAASTTTWSLWTHTWRPETPGRYPIMLRAADAGIRTRRLDMFYYTREVAIDRV
jgi:DMSO/TMAO reductase YedYZ molybdopterin-dependent catalytic subunit